MLTQFRLAVFAAAVLAAVSAGQAFAFWPFGGVTRLSLAPAYGGYCEECDLSGRILAGAKMSNSNFNRSNFTSAVLTRADATSSEFEAADFTDAEMTRTTLVDAQCPHALFERTVLAHSNARGANFSHAVFDGADVTRTNFENANLSGADLRRARGLTQNQLNRACGDAGTQLPRGLRIARCD